MSNVSGINPVGWRVLIKPQEVLEKSSGGIILTTETSRDREQMANTTGVVIFAKYAGLLCLGGDGQSYRVVNDKDVVGTLDANVDLVDPYLARK
jgi:co-chaperonin GroES (HSP10)